MFILPKDFDEENPHEFSLVRERHEQYRNYLESIAPKLPPSAREFALAAWRLDPTDHRCPHDSWVEHLRIFEEATGERREIRTAHIEVKLLGAYHDGYLDLKYKNVRGYSLVKSAEYSDCHGDWLYDEVRLSENGRVLHEIEFWLKASWLIECEDIEFAWTPFES